MNTTDLLAIALRLFALFLLYSAFVMGIQHYQYIHQAATTGASDDIGDTIDYAVVVKRLRSELASRHFKLLEKLAEYIAALLLDDFGAPWVRVSIAKIGVMRDVRRVGVIIERGEAT